MVIVKAGLQKTIIPIVKKANEGADWTHSQPKGTSKGKSEGWSKGGGKGGGALGQLQMLLGSGGGGGWGKGGAFKTFKVDKTGGDLGEFEGIIKSYVVTSHYGFIECPELAEYGDIFLHGDMNWQGFQKGQVVMFTCVISAEGQPQAIKLRAGTTTPQPRGKRDFQVDASGGELGEFEGRIKSFVWKSHYGFIECPELAEYGDIFLHGDMLNGHTKDQIVKFTCVINAEGKPVALNLRSGAIPPQGQPVAINSRPGGTPLQPRPPKFLTFKVDKSGGELGEFTGRIKSFVIKSHYGFIECPSLAHYGDIFLHGDMLNGYQQGQIVKFTCVLNAGGKPVAINLRSA